MGIDSANAKQFGGDHYKKHKYQHWDFVCDLELPYLIGCATKYVSRWRDKGKKLDLEKAVHYLEKAMERGVPGLLRTGAAEKLLEIYGSQLSAWERRVVMLIVWGDYEAAIGELDFQLENVD